MNDSLVSWYLWRYSSFKPNQDIHCGMRQEADTYFSTVCKTDMNKDIGHNDKVRLARNR